jgi:hypothetical protein
LKRLHTYIESRVLSAGNSPKPPLPGMGAAAPTAATTAKYVSRSVPGSRFLVRVLPISCLRVVDGTVTGR